MPDRDTEVAPLSTPRSGRFCRWCGGDHKWKDCPHKPKDGHQATPPERVVTPESMDDPVRWLNYIVHADPTRSLANDQARVLLDRIREQGIEIDRLKTRGGIARSLIPVAQVEKFHRRCKELGV